MDVYRLYKLACAAVNRKILNTAIFFEQMDSQKIVIYVLHSYNLRHTDEYTYKQHQVKNRTREMKGE